MVTATKTIKNARWYLEKDERYFLREFDTLNGLKRDLESASKLHKLAKAKDSAGMLRVVESDLKSLERQQRWQQFRSRYPKLKEAMEELLQLPVLTTNQKTNIRGLLQTLSVWEGNLLRDTVEKLDPLIRGKKPNEINWAEAKNVASQLERDLQALVAVDKQLKDAAGLK